MYNYCINPCQSLGYRVSHSLSFTDYHTPCFLTDRSPISLPPSSSYCCCGCSNSIYRLPINPSLLYGLRQSTLIQFSPSRRLLLNGRNHSLSRFSVFDTSCSCEKYGSFKERGGVKGGRWGKGRYRRMVYEGRSEGENFGNVADEVEMMLSLLTEDVGEECFGVRERNGRSSWKVKVEDQKRENSDGISYGSGKKNVRAVGIKSSLKRDQKYDGAWYREEVKRQKEDRREEEKEEISRCEDCRLKIEGSTSKSNQVYDIARYREETKRQKEDRKEERIDNLSRSENRRSRKEDSAWKTDQESNTTRYNEEIKRQKEDRRERVENLSKVENRKVRKEESTWKSDQEYNISRYKDEIKRQEVDKREEVIENISRIENRRERKEGSALKSDQDFDTTRYRVDVKRQKEDRKYEEKENIVGSENRKVRKEGSTFRIYHEYDTAGYEEDIKRQKDDRREEERDDHPRSENRRLRKGGSSCSSYYSVSSAGEFESDSELQVTDDTFVSQSSIEYKRDQKRKEDIRYDGEVSEKVERLGENIKEKESLLGKEKNAEMVYGEAAGGEHDWRKKSEKKVSEVIIEQAKSRKKLAEEHMRLAKIEQQDYVQRYDIQQQYIDKQENLALAVNVNFNVGPTEHHSQNDDRIGGQSESQIKHKQYKEMSELRSSVVETASSSQNQYSGANNSGSTTVSLVEETNGAFKETGGHFSRQDAYRWDSEDIGEASKIEELDRRGHSSSFSETRMKKSEDNSSKVSGLIDEKEEKYERAGLFVTTQAGSQVKPQQTMGISELKKIGTSSMSLSRMKADIRMKQQEENSEPIYLEAKVTDAQRSTKGKERNSTSLVESKVTDAQQVSRSCTDKKEMSSTSIVEFVDETRGRHSVTGKSELQIEPLKVTWKPLKASSFNEGMPKEVSSSYKSLKLIPESESSRSSRPPSELSSESFKSGKSELQSKREERSSAVESDVYGGDKKRDAREEYLDFTSHEDALGSSDRLQQSSMHFVGEFVDETRGRHSLIDPLKATRRPVKASSFNEGMPKEVSVSYKSLKLIPESSAQQIGEDDDDIRSSCPPSEFSSASFRSGLSELQVHREENFPVVGSDIYGRDRRRDSIGEPSVSTSHEDTLGSADRLQQSSAQFVGEFVEKVTEEVSISESQKAKKKSVGQDGLGDSRRSSRSSGAKGPSDEMWHVVDQSNQGPPEIEAIPESLETTPTTSESSVAKKNGRTLWNVIGDIVRLRWAPPRSETLTLGSGIKNSPNQSTGSEAWFSGHEADENNGENMKRDDTIFPKESQLLASSLRSMDKIKNDGGVDTSPFLHTEGALSSQAGSLPSVEGTSSGSGFAEQSFPVPDIRMRRSPMVKDTSESSSQTSASDRGKMVNMDQSVTEGKDGELKRRKFQRSDHVLKDSFDEWEEAHTLETEQRKIDEMFMREALLEARKGADMWEVPVGAVLVQHGKIIARGYNLVEDLRDSTAHAEMICIREASNVLRSWRLSDTTLYITLEPCPMCAGAILQARIDTVVWGAPNKLLGADGSWIRLFPNGSGRNDMELGDNGGGAGPVHPFHPNIIIRRGILSSECADVMQQFFQLRRKNKAKKTTENSPTPPSSLSKSHHPSKILTKMHDVFHIMFCL